MRIREMRWQDYALSGKRVKELKEYCKCNDNLSMVVQAATFANPSLSGVVVKSLITGLGYTRLSKKDYIPITGADFYAYQRRTIAILDILVRGKALGFWVDGKAEGEIKHIDQ